MGYATVDIPVEMVLITNTGKKVDYIYDVDDIDCYAESWIEECHGFHQMEEMSDREYERCTMEAVEYIEDNVTLEELTRLAYEDGLIEDDEEITAWTFKTY